MKYRNFSPGTGAGLIRQAIQITSGRLILYPIKLMIDWLAKPMVGSSVPSNKPRPRLMATKIPKIPHVWGREG